MVVFATTAVVDAYKGSADGVLDLGFGRTLDPWKRIVITHCERC